MATAGESDLVPAGDSSVLARAASISKYPAPTVKMSYWALYVVLVTLSVQAPALGKTLLAVFISRALIWSGVMAGFCWMSSAAAPLAYAVAMLVPLSRRYAVEFPTGPVAASTRRGMAEAGKFEVKLLSAASALTSRLPGATRSGFAIISSAVGPLEL